MLNIKFCIKSSFLSALKKYGATTFRLHGFWWEIYCHSNCYSHIDNMIFLSECFWYFLSFIFKYFLMMCLSMNSLGLSCLQIPQILDLLSNSFPCHFYSAIEPFNELSYFNFSVKKDSIDSSLHLLFLFWNSVFLFVSRVFIIAYWNIFIVTALIFLTESFLTEVRYYWLLV